MAVDMTDKFVFFDARARGEVTRMLYAVAGKEFEDVRVTVLSEEWEKLRKDLPLGRVPMLDTPEGVLTQSNVIARHVARKLGLIGETKWEEALHDLVFECAIECINNYPNPGIYKWLVFKSIPVPDNSEEILREAREKWIQTLNYIQTIAEKRGKKYIVGDELGLAELSLYAGLELSKRGAADIMIVTPWTKTFTEKVAKDPKLTQYLAERPETEWY